MSGNGVGQNPYSFHSGIQDRASGLVKFGIRWYNPITGTWTQQDTLDAPLDPSNGNRYVFAGGDPVNGLDSTGAVSEGRFVAVGGDVLIVATVLAGAAATVGSGGTLGPAAIIAGFAMIGLDGVAALGVQLSR